MDFFDNNQFNCGMPPAVDCGFNSEFDACPSVEPIELDIADPAAFAPGMEATCVGTYAGIEMAAMAEKRLAEAAENASRGLIQAGQISGDPLDTLSNAPGRWEKLWRLFGLK